MIPPAPGETGTPPVTTPFKPEPAPEAPPESRDATAPSWFEPPEFPRKRPLLAPSSLEHAMIVSVAPETRRAGRYFAASIPQY